MSMNNDNDYIIVDDSKFNDNDSLMFINGNFRNQTMLIIDGY